MNGRRLAINRLRERLPVDAAVVDRFLARHGAPIVEGEKATFLFRGDADEVRVRHRVVGLADPMAMRRLPGDCTLRPRSVACPDMDRRQGAHQR